MSPLSFFRRSQLLRPMLLAILLSLVLFFVLGVKLSLLEVATDDELIGTSTSTSASASTSKRRVTVIERQAELPFDHLQQLQQLQAQIAEQRLKIEQMAEAAGQQERRRGERGDSTLTGRAQMQTPPPPPPLATSKQSSDSAVDAGRAPRSAQHESSTGQQSRAETSDGRKLSLPSQPSTPKNPGGDGNNGSSSSSSSSNSPKSGGGSAGGKDSSHNPDPNTLDGFDSQDLVFQQLRKFGSSTAKTNYVLTMPRQPSLVVPATDNRDNSLDPDRVALRASVESRRVNLLQQFLTAWEEEQQQQQQQQQQLSARPKDTDAGNSKAPDASAAPAPVPLPANPYIVKRNPSNLASLLDLQQRFPDGFDFLSLSTGASSDTQRLALAALTRRIAASFLVGQALEDAAAPQRLFDGPALRPHTGAASRLLDGTHLAQYSRSALENEPGPFAGQPARVILKSSNASNPDSVNINFLNADNFPPAAGAHSHFLLVEDDARGPRFSQAEPVAESLLAEAPGTTALRGSQDLSLDELFTNDSPDEETPAQEPGSQPGPAIHPSASPVLQPAAPIHILVYGSINVNLIDGSSAWLTSLTSALLAHPNKSIFVDILAHSPLVTARSLRPQTREGAPTDPPSHLADRITSKNAVLPLVERSLLQGDTPLGLMLSPFIREKRVRFIDPWRPDSGGNVVAPARLERLPPTLAMDFIRTLQAKEAYDVIIVRNLPVSQLIAREPNIARKTLAAIVGEVDGETAEAQMREIAKSPMGLFFSTRAMQEHIQSRFDLLQSKLFVIPPMVPDPGPSVAPRTGLPSHEHIRLCYVGKADRIYLIEELVAGFAAFNAQPAGAGKPRLTLTLVLSKIRGDGEFKRAVTESIAATPGIGLLPQMPRADVSEFMRTHCDVGVRWMKDDSGRELSTKLIEYASVALPILANRSPATEAFLGKDYPLFIEMGDREAASQDDLASLLPFKVSPGFNTHSARAFTDALDALTSVEKDYARLSKRVFERVQPHFASAVAKQLLRLIFEYTRAGSSALSTPQTELRPDERVFLLRRPVRIVFASHDFKFLTPVIEHYASNPNYEVAVDKWKSHTRHNATHSELLAAWADIVWCEWALGNAEWYSRHFADPQYAHKNLIVRLHRQELTAKYIQTILWSRVNHLLLITPWVYASAGSWLPANATIDPELVFNFVNTSQFDLPKHASASTTLGLLGYVPSAKRLDIAVRILFHLYRENPKWRLLVAGNPPTHYPWLMARPEETSFYADVEKRIAEFGLQHVVEYSPWTESAQWFQSVGYILSPSDFEGSHQAVAEGMASGCIPVVRNWTGAEFIYPSAVQFTEPSEAAAKIKQVHIQFQQAQMSGKEADLAKLQHVAAANKKEAVDRFSLQSTILPHIQSLFLPSGTYLYDLRASVIRATLGLSHLQPATALSRQPTMQPKYSLKAIVWMDPFTLACFSPDVVIHTVNETHWRETFNAVQPDILIIESVWLQPWNDYLRSRTEEGNLLVTILKHAREKGVPSVFWNKEDPPNFFKFVFSAFLRHIDAVFTTEERCIPYYKYVLKHSNVFASSFSAQPAVHSPVGSRRPRLGNYAFAGTYAYTTRYFHRGPDLDKMLKPAFPRGLSIFDRNLAIRPYPKFLHPFPEMLRSSLRGALSYTQMIEAYKQHEVFLSVNSVNDSNTMFSRRVLEISMSGTPVISNPSPALARLLGPDGVFIVDSEREAEEVMRRLENPLERERTALTAQRKILAGETTEHRLRTFLEKTGLAWKFPPRSKLVTVVACLEHGGGTDEEAEGEEHLVELAEDGPMDDMDQCAFSELSAHVAAFVRMVHPEKELLIGIYGRTPLQVRDESAVAAVAEAAAASGFGFLKQPLEKVPVCSLRRLHTARGVAKFMSLRYPNVPYRVFETRDWAKGACFNRAVALSSSSQGMMDETSASTSAPVFASPSPFLLFLHPGQYYGKHFLLDLLPAFDYTDAEIIGKSSFYTTVPSGANANVSLFVLDEQITASQVTVINDSLSVGLYHHQPRMEHEYVDVITAPYSSVFRRSLFDRLPGWFPIATKAPVERLLRLCKEARVVMYSCNRHNFIHGRGGETFTANMKTFVEW